MDVDLALLNSEERYDEFRCAIEQCINDCLFVAMDVEFLGLHPTFLQTTSRPTHRLSEAQFAIPKFAAEVMRLPILQVGLAFFHATPSNVWICKSFNIYINPFHSKSCSDSFEATVGSMKFLRAAGFSLNRAFRYGLAFELIRWIFDAIRERNILVLGHNCLLDLLHLSGELDPELKFKCDSYSEIKKSFQLLWPRLLDTKFLITHCPLFGNHSEYHWDLSSLSACLDSLSRAKVPHVKPVFAFPPAFEKYKTAASHHEAGYDAFVTGAIYCHCVEFLKHSKDEDFDVPLYMAMGMKHGFNPRSRNPLEYSRILFLMKSIFVVDLRRDLELMKTAELQNIVCLENISSNVQNHHIFHVVEKEFGSSKGIITCALNGTENPSLTGAASAEVELEESEDPQAVHGAAPVGGIMLIVLPLDKVVDDSVVSRLNGHVSRLPNFPKMQFSSFRGFLHNNGHLFV